MHDVCDLRSALDLLAGIDGQLVQTDVPVSPHAELAGVYRRVGAGGTVMRPTKEGPAMVFNSIEGMPGARVAIGVLASRKRVGYLLGEDPDKLGFLLNDALDNAIQPIEVPAERAACQEVVHLADEPGFDIRKLVPAPTNTAEDAGPYITLGMCYASDPETGESDVTIHRLCLQSENELSMYFVPGARHLDVFRKKAEEAGRPLPISVSIGVDPAIEIASCFEPPTTPLGFDELSVAGGIRKRPVELARCLTVDARCIANAEYVIEGELVPEYRIAEDRSTGTGKAMPEFPGYTGPAVAEIPVIRVTAVTHRIDPIMQTCIGPSEEHVSMAGIPTEASILRMVQRALPGFVKNVHCPSFGGGKYVAFIQVSKAKSSDEGKQRQAALLAFSAFSELKHVFVVDEDVDVFDINDVLWAMTTRFQGDVDTVMLPGVRCHPLDPSASPDYSPTITEKGCSCKMIFDCTVPYAQKGRFVRSRFADVVPAHWLPGWEE